MEEFKYFTKEENVYTKTPQRALYYFIALFLFGATVLTFIYGGHTKGGKMLMVLLGTFDLLLLLRAGSYTRFDVYSRTIIVKSFIFTSPKVFHFDDFQNFLIFKQSLVITLNATVALIVVVNGKKRNLLLHQTLFTTKPLQRVIDETSEIMGI